MRTLVFATGNEGKMREIRAIFAGSDWEVLSMKEAGIAAEIEENGTSFAENACIKAETVMRLCGQITLADDSGLEVDYLDGAPGIYSARFLGEETSYETKNRYLLEQLAGVPEEKRTARFVCAIACALPEGRTFTTQAAIEGRLAEAPAGENGFGYDPIFYVPEYQKTTAELSSEEKNKISHRAKALQAMKEMLKEI